METEEWSGENEGSSQLPERGEGGKEGGWNASTVDDLGPIEEPDFSELDKRDTTLWSGTTVYRPPQELENDANVAKPTNGGVPEGRQGQGPGEHDIVLPDNYANLESAIGELTPGQKIYVRDGSHMWSEILAISQQGVSITGDENARLIGSWLLKIGSSGGIENVSLALNAGAKSSHAQYACVMGFGGKWSFRGCELRGIRCTVLRVAEDAKYDVEMCNIGGIDNTFEMIASNCLVAMDNSEVSLQSCTVEDSGDDMQRPLRTRMGEIIEKRGKAGKIELVDPSGGVKGYGEASVRLEACTFKNNDVSVQVAEDSSVSLLRCKMACGDLALFSARDSSRCSSLNLTKCSRSGAPEWLDDQRPWKVFENGRFTSHNPLEKAAAEAAQREADRKLPTPLEVLLKRMPSAGRRKSDVEELKKIYEEDGRVPEFDEDGLLIRHKSERGAASASMYIHGEGRGIGDYLLQIPSPIREPTSSAARASSLSPRSPRGANARASSLSPRSPRGRGDASPPLTPKSKNEKASYSPRRSPQTPARPRPSSLSPPATPTSRRGGLSSPSSPTGQKKRGRPSSLSHGPSIAYKKSRGPKTPQSKSASSSRRTPGEWTPQDGGVPQPGVGEGGGMLTGEEFVSSEAY